MPLVSDPQSVPAGAVAPYALTYVLTSRSFDLSKVTSARFAFRRASGTGLAGSWAATTSKATPRSVTLRHVFVAGDVPEVDRVVFEPRIVIASLGAGELVGATRTLYVVAHPSLER